MYNYVIGIAQREKFYNIKITKILQYKLLGWCKNNAVFIILNLMPVYLLLYIIVNSKTDTSDFCLCLLFSEFSIAQYNHLNELWKKTNLCDFIT